MCVCVLVCLCMHLCAFACAYVNFLRRNHNVRDILKGISLGSKNLSFCDASNHFHHLFFFGDLNYRIAELDSVVNNYLYTCSAYLPVF